MFIAVSAILSYRTLGALVNYSLNDESSSQIILIPLVSCYLLYMERKRIFSNTKASIASGLALVLSAVILYFLAARGFFPLQDSQPLTLETFSIVLVWIGGFLLCYGYAALRAAAFPLLFLLLMIPLPEAVLNRAIYALQVGSTEIAVLAFRVVGTPVFRQGFLLAVPGVTVEVAKECSSIRSSVALFITCLLAAHLYLRTGWKKILLVLLSFPLAIVKNGIRIATLTLLSIHVDPSFLTGNLHHRGGFVFFILALVILWPIFLWMEKSEKPLKSTLPSPPGSQNS